MTVPKQREGFLPPGMDRDDPHGPDASLDRFTATSAANDRDPLVRTRYALLFSSQCAVDTCIWEQAGCPAFAWDHSELIAPLVAVRLRQRRLLGRMQGLAHMQIDPHERDFS